MAFDSPEQDLIARVVAAPELDAPRLAYADWLAEHGDEPRAQLIRVQCDLERLRQEERDLLAQFGSQWRRPLDELHADMIRFHRGFPEEFRIHPQYFFENLHKIQSVTPITHLTLRPIDDAYLGHVAALESCRHLRALRLIGGDITQAGIRSLAKSPHLANLRELTLESNTIGALGIRRLVEAPFLDNLTRLELDGDQHVGESPEMLRSVVDALNPNCLREFKWFGTPHSPQSHLLNSIWNPSNRSGPTR